MSTKTVNISFQDELLRDIDRVARQESRSRSELLREASRMYIERRKRWSRLFDAGQRAARRRGLKPSDIEQEIKAHRQARKA